MFGAAIAYARIETEAPHASLGIAASQTLSTHGVLATSITSSATSATSLLVLLIAAPMVWAVRVRHTLSLCVRWKSGYSHPLCRRAR